jgi:hypothetical protein
VGEDIDLGDRKNLPGGGSSQAASRREQLFLLDEDWNGWGEPVEAYDLLYASSLALDNGTNWILASE